MNKKFFTLLMLVAVMFTFSAPQAMALTESQISAILGLLSAFDADQTTIDNVENSLRGKPTTSIGGSKECINIMNNLYLGANDASTGGDVTKLQKYLTSTGNYTFGRTTGYFGPATERAVMGYQRAQGIVSSGSPETTGYGVVGPKTRDYTQNKTCGEVVILKPLIPVPVVTLDESTLRGTINPASLVSNSRDITITGTAFGTNLVNVIVEEENKINGWASSNGGINVVNGKWSISLKLPYAESKYKVRVYDDRDPNAMRVKFLASGQIILNIANAGSAEIDIFKASKYFVLSGQYVNLKWEVSAKSCDLYKDNLIVLQNVSPHYSSNRLIQKDNVFKLICRGSDGKTDEKSLSILVENELPTPTSFQIILDLPHHESTLTNPTISGTATDDIDVVVVSLWLPDKGTVYTSNSVSVIDNKWSVTVSEPLENGVYTVFVHNKNNYEIMTKGTLVVESTISPIPILNQTTVKLISPSQDQIFSVGGILTIRSKYTGVVENSQVVVRVTRLDSSNYSIVGQSKELSLGSGEVDTNWVIRTGFLDAGVYEIKSQIKECVPMGCVYSNAAVSPSLAEASSVRITIIKG